MTGLLQKTPRTRESFRPFRGVLTGTVLFLLYFSSCASFSARTEKIPVTQKGGMSEVTLAIVERQNFINDGERTYTHPDGLVFYFVINPAGERSYPAIKDSQNFTIDGNEYWRNLPGSIDSYTVIYSPGIFALEHPAVAEKIGVVNKPGAFVQKTIICGEKLPPKGLVRYVFHFGFEQELEEFEFLFRLQDVL
ncbi:MAG: hypothetical protein LBH35_02610 [Treponema sp.]|jgi:hypothetical protein|nr:hypothetical protein [Treponema sp.]